MHLVWSLSSVTTIKRNKNQNSYNKEISAQYNDLYKVPGQGNHCVSIAFHKCFRQAMFKANRDATTFLQNGQRIL